MNEIDKNFEQVAAIIENARANAFRKVNEELILMYWNVGRLLSEKAKDASYGDGYVDALSSYIQEKFPGIKGFNRRGLYRMKQFMLEIGKPMELKYFDDCIAWWKDRKPIDLEDGPKAKCYTAEYLLKDQGCNIDLCGHSHEEEEVLDPLDTIRNYQEKRATLNAEIDHVLAQLEALLPGGDLNG